MSLIFDNLLKYEIKISPNWLILETKNINIKTVIFISILFGNSILGIFSISRRIVSIPEMVISRPLETYFRRKVFTNNSLNTQKLKTTFFKYLGKLRWI